MSVGVDWNPASGSYVDQEKQSFDVWALIRRRKWLIVVMLVIGLGLGYLYYEKATRIYETGAQVLVTERKVDVKNPLNPLGTDVGIDSLTTHAQLMRSPLIVQRAVEKFRLGELTSLQSVQPQNLAAKIIGDLLTGRAGGREASDSQVLQITYRSTNVVDAMTVVKAVVRSYQDFLGETYLSDSEETIRLLTEARDVLGVELKKNRDELRKFTRESPSDGIKEPGQLTPPQETKKALDAERLVINRQRARLRGTIATVEAAVQEGKPTDAILMLLEEFRAAGDLKINEQVNTVADMLFPLLLEQQQLSITYGPQHPRVKELDLKINLIQQHLETRNMMVSDTNRAQRTPEQFIATILDKLHLDLKRMDNDDNELAELHAKAEKEAQFLQDYQVQYKVLNDEIRYLEDLYQLVLQRFKQIDLTNEKGGFKTEMIAPPDFAMQVEPNAPKVMSVAGFLGLCVGLGLAYLVDMADKSFRNPEEVRHELGVPILGHLPVIVNEMRRKKKDAPPSAIGDIVCAYHRPKSTYSEAYRAVRTALNFGIRGEGHKVIQVTSPDPGDGKSTLSANLAVCMAQSGRRVLLVDADFRRPRIHKLFGLEAGVGMSALIKGTADLPEVVLATEIDNLFVLPCGPRPSNPSELLSSTRFSELIHVLREQYDIVIIDTPPVLAVTDPCVVAPRVDGVVLLIRITKHVRPHAKRALESLESLGANLIGIVVNGVGGNRPGMGYGFGSQYGYRYATNSGYYDSYSYNYGGYHHYYDDGDESPTEEQMLRKEGYVPRSQN